ncbi:restriction-modification system specificity determinant [Bifidobacterium margollesii]|uniref:Restriction-modification system specificity determinant n=2 Tax=Bifidobacterium margollesii TaxID=2020964 RepID=A0A2N5JA94_9BIFI|nr:restriction-modification system specificity determinant [Bifidobacterium margollesii]
MPWKDMVRVDDPLSVPLISVKLHGQGAARREIGDGKAPKPFTGNRGRAGQFVFSRIWARRGAMALIPDALDGVVVTNEFPLFEVNKEILDSRYLNYLVQTRSFLGELERISAGASGQNRVKEATFLNVRVPLPPLVEQRRIVAILDRADAIRTKRRQLLTAYDELPRSLFAEMFGDPVANPRGWEARSLGELGVFKNGLNFGKGEFGHSLKVVGVGDFGARFNLKSFDGITEISLSQLPDNDYLLKNEDILFVRSNGNKSLVGRSLLVYPDNERVSYSGFCIRFRIGRNVGVSAVYLNSVLHSQSVRQRLLKHGRGANISNLNQKMLQAVNIPIPPLPLQREFAHRVEAIESARRKAERALALDDELFASLQSQAFRA